MRILNKNKIIIGLRLIVCVAVFSGSVLRGCSNFTADNLASLVETVCVVYEDVTVASCAAIPLSQASFDEYEHSYTIPAPGNYCLTEDITGTLFIGAFTGTMSNVTIDLNGFNITGTVESIAIGLFGTVEHVLIKNGSLAGNGLGALHFAPNGSVYTDIKVRDVMIDGVGGAAILVDSGGAPTILNYFLLERVTTQGDTLVFASNCSMRVIDCSLNSAQNSFSSAGLSINSSDTANIFIDRSTIVGFVDANAFCYFATGGVVVATNSVLSAALGAGASISKGSAHLIQNCLATSAESGGFIFGSFPHTPPCILERSVALNNLGVGFFASTSTNGAPLCLERHCIAESNSAPGFQGGLPLHCIACNNSINYFDVPTPVLPVGSTDFQAGYNVSCD